LLCRLYGLPLSSDIHDAMRTLTPPDPHKRDAVLARQAIDLRIGAAFTRWQTDYIRRKFGQGRDELARVPISYGPCQFPTLGFVVERFLQRQRFVPQDFWTIELEIKQENGQTPLESFFPFPMHTFREARSSLLNGLFLCSCLLFLLLRRRVCTARAEFRWERRRVFDRLVALVLFEDVVEGGSALIVDINNRQTTRSRPVPLATVEMQKNLSRPPYRMPSSKAMEVAEKLYQRGFISYPRTETDKFKEGEGEITQDSPHHWRNVDLCSHPSSFLALSVSS
jgi:DNA topoisomerase-3